MRLLSLYSARASSVTTYGLCLLLAALVTGCASKNPLMDEPVAAGKAPVPAATQAQTPAPSQTAEAKPAAASVPAGVQVTKQRRFLGIFSPYRISIQQGNFVSQEMIAQVKEGMTPDQVRFVLGTPLLMDMFHANRWDYPFRLVQGTGEVTSSRVTVFFKENRVARIEGGNLPTEKDFLALIADSPSKPKVTAPEKQTPPTAVDETIQRQQY